jgi:hypothetical protein
MISTFLTEEKTIKNNVLSIEVTQAEKETDANLRTIRMEIKEIQVPNNSNDKE